jgi:sterol desaturase/sphingolipid hydroxylase (fatty acid hydroxylase superfamily)
MTRGVSLSLCLLLAVEVLFPKGAIPIRSRLIGLKLQSIFILATAIWSVAWGIAVGDLRPMIPSGFRHAHPAFSFGAALLVHDFLFYVMHRVQHRYFWRFHAVHHSIEDLGALNSVNHITEGFFAGLFISTPMFLLGVEAGFWVTLILAIQGVYLHTATRLNFGSLRWLFNDNRFHRIHHSRERQHWDKNFSLIFPFWDLVFGTAHMHDPDAWPATGVHDIPEATGAWDYVIRPFLPKPKSNSGPVPVE